MDKTSLGDRIKEYERASLVRLPRRLPVIIRLDGNAFHTFTKRIKAARPFDDTLMNRMVDVSKLLIDQVQGALFAYTQSDEISLLLHNYQNPGLVWHKMFQPWELLSRLNQTEQIRMR